MTEDKREVIYYYPKFIPGRAFTVAAFETPEEADKALELLQVDKTFTFDGQTYPVDLDKGLLRRAYDWPAEELP